MEEQTITLLKECNSGCNMGIQSVSECMNKCREASHASIRSEEHTSELQSPS